MTIEVKPGYFFVRIGCKKSFVPGMYMVAPRQYLSMSLSVYLSKLMGSITNLELG
jgi:hypothetical protein